MVLETLALIALWKLATRSSKKKVLVRRRRRSTAGSVFALIGLAAVSTLLGSPRKKKRAARSQDWGPGHGYSGGWGDDDSGEV
jgi:hypothetical protein